MALLFELRQKLVQGFHSAWALWPRKDKKIDAEKAWNQKVTTPEIEEKVFTAFKWQIPQLLERDPQYRPLLGSWLRGEEWNNEPPTPKSPTPNRPTAPVLKLNTDAWDQQTRTEEAIRLMRDEGLTREEAIRRAFK